MVYLFEKEKQNNNDTHIAANGWNIWVYNIHGFINRNKLDKFTKSIGITKYDNIISELVINMNHKGGHKS